MKSRRKKGLTASRPFCSWRSIKHCHRSILDWYEGRSTNWPPRFDVCAFNPCVPRGLCLLWVAVKDVWFGVLTSLLKRKLYAVTSQWSNLRVTLAITLVSTTFHCFKRHVTMASGSQATLRARASITATTTCDESSSVWQIFGKWHDSHFIAMGHESAHMM